MSHACRHGRSESPSSIWGKPRQTKYIRRNCGISNGGAKEPPRAPKGVQRASNRHLTTLTKTGHSRISRAELSAMVPVLRGRLYLGRKRSVLGRIFRT